MGIFPGFGSFLPGGNKGLAGGLGGAAKKKNNENTLINQVNSSPYSTRSAANLRNAIGAFSGGGITDREFAPARERAQGLAGLLGMQTANRVSQGYGNRGIRSAGVLKAAQKGGLAEQNALSQLLTPLDVEAARSRIEGQRLAEGRGLQLLGMRGAESMSERELALQLLSILRRRGDIEAGKQRNPIAFETPFGGIQF
jgi:hypothetical protein